MAEAPTRQDEDWLGVILAAGCGSRIGIPKAVLKLKDLPLAVLQYRTLKNAGINRLCVVVGCKKELVLPTLEPFGIELAINDNWKQGQFSSLLTGLHYLEAWLHKTKGVFVLPVDTVGVQSQTFEKLALALQNTTHLVDAAKPVFNGRGGHPVLLSARFALSLFNFDPASNRLDKILRSAQVLFVPVSDSNVVSDIDTLADLHRLKLDNDHRSEQ